LNTLYIPKGSLAAYKAAPEWSSFSTIVELDSSEPLKQCASPTVSYKEGHLTFSSETEGAKYHYILSDNDVNSSYVDNIGDVPLSGAYNIVVYATAEDFTNSEVATATLFWIDGTTSTDIIEKSATHGVLVKVNGSVITLSGLTDHESVSYYTVNGTRIGTSTASGGETNFNTRLTKQVVIVKIGNNSIKIATK